MGRRKRATKTGDLTGILVAGAVFYYAFHQTLSWITMALITLTVLAGWVSFVMPTHCDYQTLRGTPCDRGVRGKLRGCHSHDRWKRDALFSAIRLRNPGLLFRVMWSAPGSTAGSVPTTGPGGGQAQTEPSKQSASDVAMLTLTVVSTVATVIALFK
jgi:hypothetical protein